MRWLRILLLAAIVLLFTRFHRRGMLLFFQKLRCLL
jgi:hypothetical protein